MRGFVGFIKRATAIVAAGAVLSAPLMGLQAPEKAAAVGQQKGATLHSTGPNGYGSADFKQSVDNFAALGGTNVSLLYPIYQQNLYSSSLSTGWDTPTDQALFDGIAYAHSKGLSVMVALKPYSMDGNWHADIDPTNRGVWFDSYQYWLMKLAGMAADASVEQLSIGTELYKVTSQEYNGDNTWRWRAMIDAVRGVFPGSLVYGSQHSGGRSELLELGFGDKLDYVGISAYFPLTAGGSTPEEALMNSWAAREARVSSAQSMYGRPIIFTEAGYRSVVDSHIDPYSYWREGPVDLEEQSRNFDALFRYWTSKAYYAGTYIWGWEVDPTAGGPDDTSYSPQNKPAQNTICKWYTHDGAAECGGGYGGGPVDPDPTPDPDPAPTIPPEDVDYSTTGSMPATANVGSSVHTTVDVTTNADVDGIVQVAIYDEEWQPVAYRDFHGQRLVAGQSSSYSMDWTPSAAGTYIVCLGVFKADWSVAYTYEMVEDIQLVAVQGGGGAPAPDPGTPSASYQIGLWWPNSSALQGNQPVKAIIDGLALADYDMYWQVDGSEWVLMQDSDEVSPHKRGTLETWRWTAGAHQLKLVAKDAAGNVIAQIDQTINVVH